MSKNNYNRYFNAVLQDDVDVLNELTPQISDILYRFLLIRYGLAGMTRWIVYKLRSYGE
jgi:hypothetical protein